MGHVRASWMFLTDDLELAISSVAVRVASFQRFRGTDPHELASLAIMRLRDLVLAERPGLLDRVAGEGFITSLVVNVAREQGRWQRKAAGAGTHEMCGDLEGTPRGQAEEEGCDLAAAPARPADSTLNAREMAKRAIASRLRALDPPPTPTQLDVLRLRLKGQSFRQIGIRLGRDASSLRERLRRLVRRLQGAAGKRSDHSVLPIVHAEFPSVPGESETGPPCQSLSRARRLSPCTTP